jgi:purine nucleosidase
MKRQIVIDTDPGLDDAIAIIFAVASGRFDVVGITTVAGNIGLEQTTRNAGSLLAMLGRSDIPVVSGASQAMLRNNMDELLVHGGGDLRDLNFREPVVSPRTGATAWLAETLRAAPSGAIDVLALGPLTNIGKLVNEHPDAAARIGNLICMGGSIHEPGNAGPKAEFNFASDPEAVALVLRASIRTTIVALDLTRTMRADRAYLEALRGTVPGDMAADLLAAWWREGELSRPLHDPSVMLLALAPELFEIEMRRVSVDLSDGPDAGALVEHENVGQPVSIAMRVDAPAALALLASGLR